MKSNYYIGRDGKTLTTLQSVIESDWVYDNFIYKYPFNYRNGLDNQVDIALGTLKNALWTWLNQNWPTENKR